MQLIVEKLTKAFGAAVIFKDVSFMVETGKHLGLVGVNGSGKTTLLKCLLKPQFADAGSVRFADGVTVGYVQQGFTNVSGTVWDFTLQSCREILSLREKIALLEARASTATAAEQKTALLEYARLTKRYEDLEGYQLENKIKRVLIGLGYTEEWWQREAATLSGGQKTRLLLAAALVRNPDFLILDEPTNHLDIYMTQWLENYLRAFKGGLLAVSHDRAFLDNIAAGILEMEAGRLRVFRGNYTRYLEQKELLDAAAFAVYNAQQEYIARTQAYIRRFKAGIKAKMARGRQLQLDRLQRLEAPTVLEEFTLRLPKASECAERVLELENLSIGYGEQVLAKKINLTVRRGEKIALIGANGTGKTTLLRTLLGEIEALSGKVKIGSRVQIGYFSQSYERLRSEETLLENLLKEYGYTEAYTRTLLGRMLFHGDAVFEKIGSLSGGQKARLVLLKLVLDGANFLVLDEPTNHLDIMARETVETALLAFDGTVLLVSHDRYFISEVAERIWEIEQTAQTIKDYQGNYAYYLAAKTKAAEQAVQLKTVPLAAKKPESNASDKLVVKTVKTPGRRYSPEEATKLLPKVELAIREQEALQKLLEKQMADPLNHQTLEQSKALAEQHETYVQTIAKLLAQWEELMAAAESEQ